MRINRRHFLVGASQLVMWPLLARAGKLDEQLPAAGAKLRFAVRLDSTDVGEYLISFRNLDSMDGALIQSRVDEIAELLESNIRKEHVRLHANDRSAEAWFENDILVKGQILRNGHTIHYHLA